MQKKMIWVLAISHEYGVDCFAGETENAVRKALAKFCRYWWRDEITDKWDVKRPKTNAEVIDKYFDYVENETYSIACVEILK